MLDAFRYASSCQGDAMRIDSARFLHERYGANSIRNCRADSLLSGDRRFQHTVNSVLYLGMEYVMQRKVLNVGGRSKSIALPPQYADFEHVLLDIDPSGSPDIVCDARSLNELEPDQFDAVYCSHNLEHYFWHDVPRVLDGFIHVLKPNGFAHIRVPDIGVLIRTIVERNMDLEDVAYRTASGAVIAPLDILYGYRLQIQQSGKDYYQHKTGFSLASLRRTLAKAGFEFVFAGTNAASFDLTAIAFMERPDPFAIGLFNLPMEDVPELQDDEQS